MTQAVNAAGAAHALSHFEHRLSVETDVADVAAALDARSAEFVVVDARGPEAYAAGHVPGALSLPHASIDQEAADGLPGGLIVAYCWGPACNGAVKAAARLAGHGRQVKEMLGGFEYWEREGHRVERGV